MLFFFLMITSFIWVLTKFSKEFTTTLEASINYTDIPNSKILSASSSENITFDHTSSGFDFLTYKLKKPIIDIPINSYYKKKNKISIPKDELKRIINSKLKTNISINNISIDTLYIELDSMITKSIPVFPDIDITYQKGFKATQEIQLNPESIEIIGPSTLVRELNSIPSKALELTDVNSTISGEIELDNSIFKSITFSENTIAYSLKVEEFTQKELLIPLEIVNLPDGTKLKLIPEELAVIFDVSVSKFNTINNNEFAIVCDYLKRNEEQNFLIPELTKISPDVQNVSLSSHKVKYLIFK